MVGKKALIPPPVLMAKGKCPHLQGSSVPLELPFFSLWLPLALCDPQQAVLSPALAPSLCCAELFGVPNWDVWGSTTDGY